MTNYITLTQYDRTVIYYFDNWDDGGEEWEGDPENMVDNDLTTYAYTTIDGDVQLLTSNSTPSDRTETISAVEIRAFTCCNPFTSTITSYLRPVFNAGDGDDHGWIPPDVNGGPNPFAWSPWFDITEDTNAPSSWDWEDVYDLDCDHYPDFPVGGDPYTLETAKVQIRVTYHEECTLIAPSDFSLDHDRNVRMVNFWNGDRDVYDVARSSKTLVLNGIQWGIDACDRITCVRNLGRTGVGITLTGMNVSILDNKNYKIRSFGWKLRCKRPLTYIWILELEYDE